MKRDKITISENMVIVTGGTIWMTETEIVELFGTTPGAGHTGTQALLQENTTRSANVFVWTAATVRTCIILKWLSPLHSVFVRRA